MTDLSSWDEMIAIEAPACRPGRRRRHVSPADHDAWLRSVLHRPDGPCRGTHPVTGR